MRRPDPALADRLFEEPYLFDFFQAVRVLEKLGGARGPVGHDVTPAREAVRFVSDLSLNFPPSAISSLEPGRPGETPDDPAGPPRMSTPFMGLLGASGALPTVYTSELINLRSRRNAAAIDFINLFHHRLISLFYRAWEKYHVPALWDRGRAGTEDDAFSKHLYELIGLAGPAIRDRLAVPDRALIFYTGFFSQQHRPAVCLELLIGDHFGRAAKVISFFGQWLRLQEDQRSRMGSLDGAFNRLGVDTVAGRKVWDDQSKFRVRVGPLGFDDFGDFLPGGRLADELMDLIRAFARAELDFDVQLVLKAEEVPWCRLSKDSGTATRLGRTSWLRAREFVRDADDSVARPSSRVPPRSPTPR